MKTLTTTTPLTVNGVTYRKIIVKYGLKQYRGQQPYFAVTAEGWYKGSRRRDPDVGGAAHDLAVAAFPELADLVALHLSTSDGIPTHAAANGWYWLSNYGGKGISHVPPKWQELTPQQRAEAYLRAPAGWLDGVTTREEFNRRVEDLRPQWQAEAESAINRHNLEVSPA